MKKLTIVILLALLAAPCFGLEFTRTYGEATTVWFPIVDVNSANLGFLSSASGLDTEISKTTNGSAIGAFADCANEATESGSTGVYGLILTAAECTTDFAILKCTTTDANGIIQVVSVNFTIAEAIFDRAMKDFKIKNSTGDALKKARGGDPIELSTGTATAGTVNTIALSGSEVYGDDDINGNLVKITAGTGLGQSRVIVDFVGSTEVCTVDKDFITTPDATSVYGIIAAAGSTFVDEGIAQAGGATTITLASTADDQNDLYVGMFVKVTSGTGSGQSARVISAYNGTTKVATVSGWGVNPDATSAYTVLPARDVVSDGGSVTNVSYTDITNATNTSITNYNTDNPTKPTTRYGQ